jgi:hypothetical protein
MRGLFAVVLLLISTPAVAQDTAPTTTQVKTAPIQLNAETFAATPFMERPSLSPNGRFVAARVSTPRGQSLVILSITDKSVPIVGINLDSSKIDVDSWRWVNEDWLVLLVSVTDEFEGEKIRVRRLASVERSTGKITLLARKAAGQDAGNIIWVARDGSPRILLGVQNSIYLDEGYWPEVNEVDVSTGKMKVVVPSRGGILDYYADGNGVVRLGYGYDREKRVARLILSIKRKRVFQNA